ncbi:serine hydrolase domain-containing protein [Aquabacterium sp.]|uniref:serine hydrolase domain-containing protein n=1 Tax=Aquabacterium sp. TaxID=1872578 RepID=UPI003D6CE5C7
MKLNSHALLGAGAFIIGGLGAAFLPSTAIAAATLQIVEGSGEFQFLKTAVTVVKPQILTLQWTTDQAAATGGTWQVTNAANQVVASGEAAAPTPGHFLRFNLPANAFLVAPTVATATKFNIKVTPHNAANVALGAASPTVTVTEVPDTTQPPIVLGDPAKFPKVEIINYDEKIGVVPQTQIHYAGADVTLRVSNKTNQATDPMWLSLKDFNVLMRQNSSRIAIPALAAGASQTLTVHLDAVLPPAQSQLPQDQQYAQWSQQYRAACGIQLRSVMDWRGAQANTPMGDHLESLLVKEGWSDYAKVPPSVPVCNGKACVSVCEIEKKIRAQLDGKVTGYSFFVGNYPKFGSGGQARTNVDGDLDFASNTKITVASVSKFVTAVAAVRILDKAGVSLDAAIGPYLPADWSSASAYVKGITFSQLLGQRSGIKDYGNVSQDYAQLKKFFTASVNPKGSTSCQKSDVVNPMNPINTTDMGWCYSNYNFAIMRVLLPKVAGFAEDANQGSRPQTLANQYVQLVQQNVFDRVGQAGVSCKPPVSNNHAYAYKGVGSNAHGTDFGDVSLVCGAAGWYLSTEDIAKVLLSLNAKDGKILSATAGKDLFDTMRKRGLGWDVVLNTELEKNGGWGANCDANKVCDTVSTSVAVFGPVVGPRLVGVLFLNSNVSGGAGAQGILEKAYFDSVYTMP